VKTQPNNIAGGGDGGGNLIGAANPGDCDGEQSLHAPERGKAKKDTNSRAKRDRVRRVVNRHQRHVMRRQPLFEMGQ